VGPLLEIRAGGRLRPARISPHTPQGDSKRDFFPIVGWPC
jgi:hypothetical protein